MSVSRTLETDEARELLDLVKTIRVGELDGLVTKYEAQARFPRDTFKKLGATGLLGLPYPVEYGAAEQPYSVYLQVLEELATSWLSVALGVSVHTLSCHPVATFGTAEQRERWLPDMVGGKLLGAYCLSEPQSGSDAAALITRAEKTTQGFVLNGTKAWITHGGQADFYTVMARTSEDRSRGISCFLVPSDTPGLSAATPERKMGMQASTTAAVNLDDVEVSADRLIGEEGQGFAIAMAALDSGRLGIAACAVGLAQSAFDNAVAYAKGRRQFGSPISDFQGIRFLLADMATSIEAARALYLQAARLKDDDQPFSTQAAMAKLFATDMCMKVTTDAVQVFGGSGYVEDFPAERLMREAKVLQIVEGTNQIQRHVIGSSLLR